MLFDMPLKLLIIHDSKLFSNLIECLEIFFCEIIIFVDKRNHISIHNEIKTQQDLRRR